MDCAEILLSKQSLRNPLEPEPNIEDKLNALDANYSSQFSELVNALGLANLDNDIALVTELQNEYYVLKAQYQQEREAILNE